MRAGADDEAVVQIDLAARVIAREINRAGLGGVLGSTGKTNVQGEEVKRLDEVGNVTFIEAFRHSRLVCRLASEEMEDPLLLPENCPEGKYLLLYDPVDGSSNIDVNVTIGSIFSIRLARDHAHQGTSEFLRPGTEQIDPIPFFIEWAPDAVHPSHESPKGCELTSFAIEHPRAANVKKALKALGIEADVTKGSEARLSAMLTGPNGKVTLR